MMKMIRLPIGAEHIQNLRAGDVASLTGTVYTARDEAHKRLCGLMDRGEPLPIDLNGLCVYYAGPCPAAPGEVIGPCGPTTASRMDAYTPALIGRGLTAMIGKGKRSAAVREAMRGKAVYFAATGGAALLIASCVRKAELVAFPDLGPEAVWRLEVVDLPVIVAVDAFGGDITR